MELTEKQIEALEKAAKLLEEKDFCPYLHLRAYDGSPRDRQDFQSKFCCYYRLNTGGFTHSLRKRYFEILLREERPTKSDIPHILRELSCFRRANRTRALHFSFVSKLVAFHDESSPLYDKHVAKFFDWRRPKNIIPKDERIRKFCEFLESVSCSYEIWQKNPRVRQILENLKNRYRMLGNCHSTRLLDFLIWKAGNGKLT